MPRGPSHFGSSELSSLVPIIAAGSLLLRSDRITGEGEVVPGQKSASRGSSVDLPERCFFIAPYPRPCIHRASVGLQTRQFETFPRRYTLHADTVDPATTHTTRRFKWFYPGEKTVHRPSDFNNPAPTTADLVDYKTFRLQRRPLPDDQKRGFVPDRPD
jgi:hypothetical protein